MALPWSCCTTEGRVFRKAITVLYAIVPFEPGEKLRSRIDALGVPVCDVEAPAAYFVWYDGTTRKLSEAVGFGNDGDVGSGVVIRVANYFGYASTELWEWLGIHKNGE